MNDFTELCQRLRHQLLSASDSHAFVDTHQQAAVAILLRQHLGIPEILIIKRAISERDHWSGHLALPGGRWETRDSNLYMTAARETMEEVGIDLSKGGELLGGLDPVTPRSPLAPQITVTPFVAVAPIQYHILNDAEKAEPLQLSYEVDTAFWIPLPLLMENGRSEIFRLVINSREREWPAYKSEHGLIWGLTERILTSFLELVTRD